MTQPEPWKRLRILKPFQGLDPKNPKIRVKATGLTQISGQKFERKDIELGISDGVYAEVLGGVSESDNIKIVVFHYT